jgi:choline dehydrogenase-like flavoprotein
MLANIVYPNLMHSKLRSSGMRHISTGEPFDLRFGKNGESLKGRNSYAAGGLSNAWGAQLFRYTEKDLADVDGWPIDLNSLAQSYLSLEEHIGISGSNDSLEDFLGPVSKLLPPQALVPAARYLLQRFNGLQGDKKILIGHTRIGVLTKNFRQYKSHQFGEIDFFSTQNEGIYTALRSLDELRSRGRMKYFGGYKLVSFSEGAEFVEVALECVKTGEIIKKRAKHLLLGCGTQQTARLVLLNKNGVNKSLPFMDHPPTLLPLFIPRMFGSSFPDKSYPIQLAATLCGDSPREMISLYYPGGLLRSDFLRDIPLPMNIASKLLPGLLGGMLVAQIWEPSKLFSGNRLYLDAESNIHIDYPYRSAYQRYGKLLPAFARLGAFSLPSMAIVSPPGTGFHYAGCLPMRKTPTEFETHVNGLLWDSKRVRVIDASIFPSLPAKNHSLTLMANASRIAKEVLRCGY